MNTYLRMIAPIFLVLPILSAHATNTEATRLSDAPHDTTAQASEAPPAEMQHCDDDAQIIIIGGWGENRCMDPDATEYERRAK